MTIKINISSSRGKIPSLQEQLSANAANATNAANALQDALASPSQTPPPTSTPLLPQITTEKYSLLATASSTLSEKTIEQFEIRMQTVIDSMTNSELPTAMERVSIYTKEHPELRPFIRAEDVQIFVQGARNSYARVAESKLKNRASKSKSAVLDSNIADALSDIIIDL